jgi:hypothetical protein
MIPLYTAGRQLAKVRFIMLLSLAVGLPGAWWGLGIIASAGPTSSDGAAGAIAVVFSLAFAIGMWVYGTCYLARIDFDPQRRVLHLRTVTLFGTAPHVLDASSIGQSRYHHGQFHARVSVNAPWVSVRVPGRRLPLLVDAQGQVLNAPLMEKYFGWSGGAY